MNYTFIIMSTVFLKNVNRFFIYNNLVLKWYLVSFFYRFHKCINLLFWHRCKNSTISLFVKSLILTFLDNEKINFYINISSNLYNTRGDFIFILFIIINEIDNIFCCFYYIKCSKEKKKNTLCGLLNY